METHKANTTIMTMRCVRACGLNSLEDYFNIRALDIWEENVTTRQEILTEHVCSLGFWDVREGVTLRRLRVHMIIV